jgi:hypothetical protein
MYEKSSFLHSKTLSVVSLQNCKSGGVIQLKPQYQKERERKKERERMKMSQ